MVGNKGWGEGLVFNGDRIVVWDEEKFCGWKVTSHSNVSVLTVTENY
jgi:hypothetical protein